MVDTMAVLGAAASAKLTGDRLVRDFVAYVKEMRSRTPEPAPKTTRRRRRKTRLSRPLKASTSGLGPRPSSSRHSKKVSLMTDSELEAELDKRRRRSARERELYSRAMRSEKLAALESELANLRREIGRIDPVPSNPSPRSGTSHSVHWEPFPPTRRSIDLPSPISRATTAAGPPVPPVRGPPPASCPPPPPPPPPPLPPGASEDEAFIVDPEQRKREKEERQRRREAKKKEREQTKQKMTLGDIIRSAGPDPMKRLKPAGRKPADIEKEEFEKQKREREEREKRQEQERIELEKKAIENMGRRVTEQAPAKKSDANGKDKAQAHQQSEVAPVEGVKTPDMKPNPISEQESSKLLNETPPVPADEPSTVKDEKLDSCQVMDHVQDYATKDVTDGKDSESSSGQASRNVATQEDGPHASNASDKRTNESKGEQNKPDVSEKLVTKSEGKQVERVVQVKTVSDVPKLDAENISPNASTRSTIPGDKPQQKVVEDAEESISDPKKL